MSGITCCKDCISPKRHTGCHTTCEEYIQEKAKWEKDKKKIEQDKLNNPVICKSAFLGDSGHNRKWKRRVREE